MREDTIDLIMFLSAIIAVYVAVYIWLQNKEQKDIGKDGYKRLHNFWIGYLLAKHRRDRSYFATVAKKIGWEYQRKEYPFLCEISYVSQENGKISFLFPWQGKEIRGTLIFYKQMNRSEREDAIKKLLKSLS